MSSTSLRTVCAVARSLGRGGFRIVIGGPYGGVRAFFPLTERSLFPLPQVMVNNIGYCDEWGMDSSSNRAATAAPSRLPESS